MKILTSDSILNYFSYGIRTDILGKREKCLMSSRKKILGGFQNVRYVNISWDIMLYTKTLCIVIEK